ncbi:hypothetical protein [Marivita sp. S2033]|uniref:hypothetical protein n=1 Tax=Marivita sp. S2033 TaxID=3373187 RepID=UPI0039827180
MKPAYVVAALVLVVAIVFGFYIIDVDRVRDGSLPSVSVDGAGPSVNDPEVGDVNVGERDLP